MLCRRRSFDRRPQTTSQVNTAGQTMTPGGIGEDAAHTQCTQVLCHVAVVVIRTASENSKHLKLTFLSVQAADPVSRRGGHAHAVEVQALKILPIPRSNCLFLFQCPMRYDNELLAATSKPYRLSEEFRKPTREDSKSSLETIPKRKCVCARRKRRGMPRQYLYKDSNKDRCKGRRAIHPPKS